MVMQPSLRIGLDIGGTKTRIGVLDDSGRVLTAATIPSSSDAEFPVSSDALRRCMVSLLGQGGSELSDVRSIGVGVAGTVDTKRGVVEYTPNLKWMDVPLGEILSESTGCQVFVEQDSRCAAWGEMLFGAGRSLNSFLMVTVGTGVGSGIIIDRRIYAGDMGTAGELGHTIIEIDGRPCQCGNFGCLERYASGSAIGQFAGEQFPERFAGRPTAEEVFRLAQTGFEPARTVIDLAVTYLAQGLVNAVDMLAVPVVIVSGGLCIHEELFVRPLEGKVNNLAYSPWKRRDEFRIIGAECGADAPMIGAAFIDRSR
jgi:glucokinase